MPTTDPRVDQYIEAAAPFAQPILKHLRALVHKHCPDVAETVKWGSPCFTYHGILCGMSAFKAHATFGFWHKLLRETEKSDQAKGGYGRITTLKDLPSDSVIAKQLKHAMKLNAGGIKAPVEKKTKKPEAKVPADLAAALKRNPDASKAFKAFSPSHRREYIEWIEEAKRPETREKRLLTTIEWLSDGKHRNWKYENC